MKLKDIQKLAATDDRMNVLDKITYGMIDGNETFDEALELAFSNFDFEGITKESIMKDKAFLEEIVEVWKDENYY